MSNVTLVREHQPVDLEKSDSDIEERSLINAFFLFSAFHVSDLRNDIEYIKWIYLSNRNVSNDTYVINGA